MYNIIEWETIIISYSNNFILVAEIKIEGNMLNIFAACLL